MGLGMVLFGLVQDFLSQRSENRPTMVTSGTQACLEGSTWRAGRSSHSHQQLMGRSKGALVDVQNEYKDCISPQHDQVRRGV
jgi:hypothetical protein